MAYRNACSMNKDLYYKVKGRTAQVKCLQRTLNNWHKRNRKFPGWGTTILVVDGDFGPSTDAQVRIIQAFFHIVVDGYVGPVTRDRLRSYIPQVWI